MFLCMFLRLAWLLLSLLPKAEAGDCFLCALPLIRLDEMGLFGPVVITD